MNARFHIDEPIYDDDDGFPPLFVAVSISRRGRDFPTVASHYRRLPSSPCCRLNFFSEKKKRKEEYQRDEGACRLRSAPLVLRLLLHFGPFISTRTSRSPFLPSLFVVERGCCCCCCSFLFIFPFSVWLDLLFGGIHHRKNGLMDHVQSPMAPKYNRKLINNRTASENSCHLSINASENVYTAWVDKSKKCARSLDMRCWLTDDE